MIAVAVLAPWLAWAVVRLGGVFDGARAVPLLAFTPYVAFTSPLPLLVALVLRRPPEALLSLAVVAGFAAAIVPRALPGPRPEIAHGVPLRVMTANIFEGKADPRALVDLVRAQRIDVLSLQELPPGTLHLLENEGLRRLLPYREVDTRPDGALHEGSGLFARFPLRHLPPPEPNGFNAEPRAMLQVPGAPPMEVQAVHPASPVDGRVAIWRHALEQLRRPGGGPVLRLLLGDFNATLDHVDLRRLLDAGGYLDAGDATGEGLRTTWPAGRRFPPELTIDHVLTDPRISPRSLSVFTVPGSDHRAVIAALVLPRTRG